MSDMFMDLLNEMSQTKIMAMMAKLVRSPPTTEHLTRTAETFEFINKFEKEVAASRIRGVAFVAVIDGPDGESMDIRVGMAGNVGVVSEALMLAHIKARAAEDAENEDSEPCEVCGENHSEQSFGDLPTDPTKH